LSVTLAVSGISAQQSSTAPVVFRAAVNYVEVDATVTDARGNAVSDLSAADFEVLEDGKRQTIASFAHVELPVQHTAPASLIAGLADLTTSAPRPIQSDVRTNTAIEGGIYLIVLDDLHTDFARTPRVKEIARQFIERAVGPGDVAAVVYTGHNGATQDFTGNRQLLLGAVDKFVGQKLKSATLIQLEGLSTVPDQQGNGQLQLGEDVVKDVRAYRARSVMGSIRQLSEFMAGIHGRRKAMVLFGEGIDYDVEQALGGEGATASLIVEDTRNAIAAAQRGNVIIYSVDPRGLFDSADDLAQTPSQFNRDTPENSAAATRLAAINNRGLGRKPPPTEANGSTLQAEVRLGQESLRALARDTGGFSVLNTNDFLRPFERIVRENSTYYLLGYYPSNDKRDGRLRKLQVRVKRSGVTVHARKGYVAPSSNSPALTTDNPAGSPVLEALGSPLPVNGIAMRMFAAPFKGPMNLSTVAFAIELDASPFNFAHEDNAWVEALEVATVAVEAGGKLRAGDHNKMTLALKPATHAAVIEHGFRVTGQANLPPGRYQLRVAVATGAGEAGSTVYDLDVPDYAKAPLTMSGLVLSSLAASQTPTMALNAGGLAFLSPPVATRSFSQSDQLTVFGEVYDNARTDVAHELTITTTLSSATGVRLRTTTDTRSSLDLNPGSAGYKFIAGMPLDDLTPGVYVIHVEARGDFGDHPSATRDVEISVTPQ
jgi:VWFA-related protein